MADSAAFDWVCGELEGRTSLDRLEARGTIRLSLKQSGLEARTVTPDQMKVVVERVLPPELEARGVEDVEPLCSALMSGLGSVAPGELIESPDAVFERLGGAG